VVIRVGLAVVLVILSQGAGPVEAGGSKAVVNHGAPFAPQRAIVPPGRQVVNTPSRVTVGPSSQVIVNAPSQIVVAPPSRLIVNAPSQIIVQTPPVLAFPVYVVEPRRCLVPGYWTYTWVPQSYTYSVWVDGQYAAEGVWIAAHWEPRINYFGYYAPYWVPDSWNDC
jgi:hypothetical protein